MKTKKLVAFLLCAVLLINTACQKPPVELALKFGDEEGGKITRVYDGKTQTAEVSVLGTENKVAYTVSYYDKNGKKLENGSLPKNAGEYRVKAEIIEEGYTGGHEVPFIIGKKPLTVKPDFTSLAQSYIDNSPELYAAYVPSYTLDGLAEGDSAASVKVDVTYSGAVDKTVFSSVKPKDPGEYKARFTVNDINYSGEEVAGFTVTMNKGIIVFSDTDFIYNGSGRDVFITNKAPWYDITETRYTGTKTGGGSYNSVSAPADAGEYKAIFTLAIKGSAITEQVEKAFNIAPRSLGLVAASNKTFTVGDEVSHDIDYDTAVFSSKAALLEELDITYGRSGTDEAFSPVPPMTAGIYNVRFSPKSYNYQATAGARDMVVIYTFTARKTAGIGFDYLSQVYGGTRAVTLTGLEAWHSQKGDITYKGVNNTSYEESGVPPQDAGYYRVRAVIGVDGDTVELSDTLIIHRKTVELEVKKWVFRAGEEITHSLSFLNVPAELGFTAEYLVDGVWDKEYRPEEYGKYRVRFIIDEPNYSANYETDYFIAGFDDITVSGSRPYNGRAIELNIEGLDAEYQSYDITYEGVDGTDYGPCGAAPVNAGKYKAVLTVSLAGREDKETLSFGFEIFPRALDVKALNALVETGQEPLHRVSCDDEVLAAAGGLESILTVSTGEPDNEGYFYVTFTSSDPNYTFSVTVRYRFVESLDLMFDYTEQTYGSTRPVILYIASHHELISFVCVSQGADAAVYDITKGEYPRDAGVYDIIAVVSVNGETTETVYGTLTIHKKAVTVTAVASGGALIFETGKEAAFTFNYNGNDPGFTPEYTVSYSGVPEGAPQEGGIYAAAITFKDYRNYTFNESAGNVLSVPAAAFYKPGLDIAFGAGTGVKFNSETGEFEATFGQANGQAQNKTVTVDPNNLNINTYRVYLNANWNGLPTSANNATANIRYYTGETSYGTSAQNAGTYFVRVAVRVRNAVSSGATTSYKDIILECRLVIKPMEISINPQDNEFDVGAAVTHAYSNSYHNSVNSGYSVTYQRIGPENELTGEPSSAVPDIAGRYLVTFIPSANYIATEGTNTAVYTFKARFGNLENSFSNLEQTYNGSLHASVTLQSYHKFVAARIIGEDENVVNVDALQQGGVWSFVPLTVLQAGRYTLVLTFKTDGEEEIIEKTVTVSQKAVQLVTSDRTFTLENPIPADKEALRSKVSGLAGYSFSVSYRKGTVDAEGVFTPDPGSADFETAPAAAGKYLVTFRLTERNYSGMVTAVYTVASTRLGVVYFNQSYTEMYTGSGVPVTPNALDDYHTGQTIIYEGTTNLGVHYGPSSAAPSELGTYNVTFTCYTDEELETIHTTLYIKLFIDTRLNNHIYQKGESGTYATGTPVPLPTAKSGESLTYSFTGLEAGAVPSLPGEYPYTVSASAYVQPAVTSGTVSIVYDVTDKDSILDAVGYGEYYYENVATDVATNFYGTAVATVLIVTVNTRVNTQRYKTSNPDSNIKSWYRTTSNSDTSVADVRFSLEAFIPNDVAGEGDSIPVYYRHGYGSNSGFEKWGETGVIQSTAQTNTWASRDYTLTTKGNYRFGSADGVPNGGFGTWFDEFSPYDLSPANFNLANSTIVRNSDGTYTLNAVLNSGAHSAFTKQQIKAYSNNAYPYSSWDKTDLTFTIDTLGRITRVATIDNYKLTTGEPKLTGVEFIVYGKDGKFTDKDGGQTKTTLNYSLTNKNVLLNGYYMAPGHNTGANGQSHANAAFNNANTQIAANENISTKGNSGSGGSCVAEGTLITLADGSMVPVEQLTGEELLLVWNMYTGAFDAAPILFIDSDPTAGYEIVHLYFSDGTEVKVIDEHYFWSFDLNQYVPLRSDAVKYIGQRFNKQTAGADGSFEWQEVRLVDVQIYSEVTTAWSPVTFGYLGFYVNGVLSLPGGAQGFTNIFDVDPGTMQYNLDAMLADIEAYGLFTYEEFAGIFPIPEVIFEAFQGQYLKISIAKGYITLEKIGELIESYAEFFG